MTDRIERFIPQAAVPVSQTSQKSGAWLFIGQMLSVSSQLAANRSDSSTAKWTRYFGIIVRMRGLNYRMNYKQIRSCTVFRWITGTPGAGGLVGGEGGAVLAETDVVCTAVIGGPHITWKHNRSRAFTKRGSLSYQRKFCNSISLLISYLLWI